MPPSTIRPVLPGSPAASSASVAITCGVSTPSQVQPPRGSVVQAALVPTTVPRVSPSNLVPPPAHSGPSVQAQIIGRLPNPASPTQAPPVVTHIKPPIISSPPSITTVSSLINSAPNRPVITTTRVPPVSQLMSPGVSRPSSLTVVAPVASVGLATTAVATTTVTSAVRPVSTVPVDERGSVVRAPVSVPHSVLASVPPGTPPNAQEKMVKVKSEAEIVRYPPGIHPAMRHSYTQPGPAGLPLSQGPSNTTPVARVSPAPAIYSVGVSCTPPTSIPPVQTRSPIPSGPGIPQYPPGPVIKSEHIKREPEQVPRPEKPKYEPPPISALPSGPKLELGKVEPKQEIKSERGDRPEIIAEVKSEPRPDIKPPTTVGIPGIPSAAALASLPPNLAIPGYAYPYAPFGYPIPMQLPYGGQPTRPLTQRSQSPLQRPSSTGPPAPTAATNPSRLSPNPIPLTTGSSTITTTSTTTKPSPTLGVHPPPPPPHLGPPVYPSRTGGLPPHISSPSKLPSSQPSIVPAGIRPSVPAVGLPGMSPGLVPGMSQGMSQSMAHRMSPGMVPVTSGGPPPLPTPPAAHTGPVVKPPTMPTNLAPVPGPSPSQPPTTQALPATVQPSHPVYTGGPPPSIGSSGAIHDGDEQDDEDEAPQHREPSPEPKIEDSEFHRSESAIFLRHWNRGDYNSCTRTDLTFKPVPNSQLARKREERLRKQAEKEKEERERLQRKASTPDKRETPKPTSSGESSSIYGSMQPRNPVDTPALNRLSDYARPHAGLSPGAVRPPAIGLPPAMPSAPPPGLDLLHFGSMAALYPPGSQERMELEARERELRELREREISDRIKQEIMKRPMNPLDAGHPHSLSPHWISASRFPGFSPPVSLASGFAHGHGLYAPSPSASSAALLAVSERERLERLAAAAAAAAAYPPRPPMLRPGEPPPPPLPPGYPPQAHHALLGRNYEELAHISAAHAHEQLQRQMLLDRERFPHLNPGGPFRPEYGRP